MEEKPDYLSSSCDDAQVRGESCAAKADTVVLAGSKSPFSGTACGQLIGQDSLL